MSQKHTVNIVPASAADIRPEWIAQVREVIRREGYAVRGSVSALVIEIQSINQPETWYALNLPTNSTLFATAQDRDQVLEQLLGQPQ